MEDHDVPAPDSNLVTDSTASSPAAVRPRFRVNIVGILAIAGVAFLAVGRTLLAHDYGQEWINAAGRQLGVLSARLLIGLLLGYGAFRLSRRRRWVGNLVLGGVLVLFYFEWVPFTSLRHGPGTPAAAANNAKSLAAIQRADAEQRDRLRQRVEETGVLDPNAIDLDASREALERQVAQTSGQTRLILDASLRVRKGIDESVRAYLVAFQAFMAAGGLKPQALRTQDDVRARLDLVQRLKEASAASLTRVEEAPVDFRANLFELGARPKVVADAVAAWQRSARLERVLAVRRVDVELAEEFLDVIRLFDENWGAWHYDEGKGRIIFDSTATLDRYNALIRAAQKSAAEEQRLQREMLGASSQPTSAEKPASETSQGDQSQGK